MLAVYSLMGGLLAAQAGTAPRAAEDLASAVRISGPVLGYYFDGAAATLRPLLGVPGAATMGKPVEMEFRLAKAAVSPAHDYLLAQVEGEAEVALLRLGAGELTRLRIAGALDSPEQIVFSAVKVLEGKAEEFNKLLKKL